MSTTLMLIIILVFAYLPTGLQGIKFQTKETTNCPMPWFVGKNDSCKCGSSLDGMVTCQDDPANVQLQPCYCMTVDNHAGETVVGSCPYSCVAPFHWYPNGSQLNYYMCTDTWKRTGSLCSQCIDGHGPLIYSYSMQCIQCSPEVVRKSYFYFVASFLPLTVFCLTIITLRISVARPPLSTFVLVSQVMSAPQYLSQHFIPAQHKSYISTYVSNSQHNMCWKLFASFFGLWNLDVFRSFYPQICLSPHLSLLQANLIEYSTALFPLVILIAVYALVNVYHRRGYRSIFCVCRPVISCLARLRQTIDIKTSLIDAFATFIILSVIKIGYTSFIILQPVHVFTPYGNYTTKAYVDPMITYFGWDHLPYALTALILSFAFILIPLQLLFLYPLKSFQTFLNNRQWQCTTLHIFADSFQGCYKDGTNGTRDYRWFAGLHLLLRFILVIIYDTAHYLREITTLATIITSFYMVLLAVCQPYKKHLHFKLDMLLLFGLLPWSISLIWYFRDGDFGFRYHLSVLVLATAIPFLYFIGLLLYWAVQKIPHLNTTIKFMTFFKRNKQLAQLLHD